MTKANLCNEEFIWASDFRVKKKATMVGNHGNRQAQRLEQESERAHPQ